MKMLKLICLIFVLLGSITSVSIWAAARGGGEDMVVEAITMLQAFSMLRGATLVGANNLLLVNYKLSEEEEAEVIEEA